GRIDLSSFAFRLQHLHGGKSMMKGGSADLAVYQQQLLLLELQKAKLVEALQLVALQLQQTQQLTPWALPSQVAAAPSQQAKAPPGESPSKFHVHISKTWNTLLGRDPTRSVSASEGEKELRGEPSFAPIIDQIPFIGGPNHCADAARSGDRSLP